MVNVVSLTSAADLPSPSCAVTLRTPLKVGGPVTVQAYEPVFATPAAIDSYAPAEPARESCRSTPVIGRPSVAVQCRLAVVPAR